MQHFGANGVNEALSKLCRTRSKYIYIYIFSAVCWLSTKHLALPNTTGIRSINGLPSCFFFLWMMSDDVEKHGKHSKEGTLSRKMGKLYAEV